MRRRRTTYQASTTEQFVTVALLTVLGVCGAVAFWAVLL